MCPMYLYLTGLNLFIELKSNKDLKRARIKLQSVVIIAINSQMAKDMHHKHVKTYNEFSLNIPGVRIVIFL